MVWLEIWQAFVVIIKAPWKDLSIWWLLVPVLLLWFLLEFYFGKYKKEKLGWNTSLANGTSLTWVSMESMRYLFSIKADNFWWRFLLIMIVMIYGFFIIYLAFTHKFKGTITYKLASPTPIYFLSAVVILWSHGLLEFTRWILLDLIIIFIFVIFLFMLIRHFIPEAEEESDAVPDFSAQTDMNTGFDPNMPPKI